MQAPPPPMPPPPKLSVHVSLAFEPESEAAAATPSPSSPSAASPSLRKKRALSTDVSSICGGDDDTHASSTNQEEASQESSSTKSSSSSSSSSGDRGIDPHDLMLLKVIGRGTFAQQVALAQHTRTRSMYVVKTLDKRNLVRRKQVAHTLAEKSVLETLGHPFIVKLYAAFQTERDLNFVLEYCQGGELFYHLQQQNQQKFDERATRFYAAEVLAALGELHSKGIVYRDLKPENVLLDAEGHVKLADFGFAKQDMAPGARTYSFCGSPEYLSPEMVTKDGHGIETDMWSFGCFCYELLTGSPPFQLGSGSLPRLFEQIRQANVWYPPDLSGPAMALLEGLLCVDPSQRLTAAQAMRHPFFKPLDWSDVLQRQVAPPIVPVCDGCDCTQNFDDGFTREPVVSLKLSSCQPSASAALDDPQQKRQRAEDPNACGFYAADPLAAFDDF